MRWLWVLLSLIQVVTPGHLSGVGLTVTVTVPTSNSTYDAGTASTLTLSGSAQSDRLISVCTWTNSLGGSGTTTGITSWSIASAALTVGSNVFTISCVANDGTTGTDVLVVTRSSSSSAFTGTVRTVTCSGDITSLMNSAINLSVNTDVVSIGAGSCSMSRLNQITDKKIWIHGAAKSTTLITASGGFADIVTNGSGAPNWFLSDMTLSSASNPGGPIVQIYADQSTSWRGPFRIARINFNYPAGGAGIYVFGLIYGQIDNIDMVFSFESGILTSPYATSETGGIGAVPGSTLMAMAYVPGGSTNLVIEDSTFMGSGTFGFSAIDTGYNGARIIFRYNTLVNSNLYAHWTSDNHVNSEWLEAYNNSFDWTTTASNCPPVFRLQGGGTGLFYNNTAKGTFAASNGPMFGEGRLPQQNQSGAVMLLCDGSHNWDGNAGDVSAVGWPCISQTGRAAGKTMAQIQAGSKQTSFPMYFWNNGPQDKCSNTAASGSACDNSTAVQIYNPGTTEAPWFKSTPHTVSGGGFGQGDVDYCVNASQPIGCGTHTLTYVPLAHPYPNPLQ